METAIVLPLMLLLVFGSLQMAMLHHARLLTEYAAFNAARSGIVWNANRCMMRRAAIASLLPALGATDTLMGTSEPFGSPRRGLLANWAIYQTLAEAGGEANAVLGAMGLGGLGLEVVDVKILNPTTDDVGLFREGRELEFDGVAGDPDFFDFEDRGATREATLLTIRVTFLCPMRVPFANWLIFHSYLAARANRALTGSITNASLGPKKTIVSDGAGGQVEGALAIAAGEAERDAAGREIYSMTVLAALWQAGLSTGHWYFPLEATHTMRMQSNIYSRNLTGRGACVDPR